MTIRLYDNLDRKMKDFQPIQTDKVKMYGCGITVYDEAHIGHAAQAMFYDVIRAYLEYVGYKVDYVRNFTDVDDKIINRANQRGMTALELSEKYIKDTLDDLHALKIQDATVQPKVSDHIQQIIDFIQVLIDKGFAYVTPEGEVLYDVMKFAEYGKLSNQNIENLINSDVSTYKKNPQDFALWKPAKPGEIYRDSPWGIGRPGWHIECSAMAFVYLGKTFDIHGGGMDLLFPHHENEIAQSMAHNDANLANYWIHNGLVMVDGVKMSKSLGNFKTIKDMLKLYTPDVIRYAILSHHYSSSIDFTDALFANASKRVYYFYKTLARIDSIIDSSQNFENINLLPDLVDSIQKGFILAMNENFNTSNTLSHLSSIFTAINDLIDDRKITDDQKIYTLYLIRHELKPIFGVLRLFDQNPQDFVSQTKKGFLQSRNISLKDIEEKISQRALAKSSKNYQLADEIRANLMDNGIVINDLADGSYEWDILIG